MKPENIKKLILKNAEKFFSNLPMKTFNIELWDSSKIGFSDEPKFTIKLLDPHTCLQLFIKFDLNSFAEAFIHKKIDITGDIFASIELKNFLNDKFDSFPLLSSIAEKLWRLFNKQTKEESKKEVEHYNVGDKFYNLFLGNNMTYTCAYFKNLNDTLDQAQYNKINHICKKLQLRKGEKLLDIGCGWGTLIIYAAKNYGVIAEGVTLSKSQYEFGNNLIKKEGLEDLCTIKLIDYRDLKGKYDKISAVGILEHIGIKNYKNYFSIIRNLLNETGLFLNHNITVKYGHGFNAKGGQFIHKYVFPNSELDNISHLISIAEESNWEILDVENLRRHYEQTCRYWVLELIKNKEKCLEVVSELTYRIWLLYLAGISVGFKFGDNGLYQILLQKNNGKENFPPLTREYMYS